MSSIMPVLCARCKREVAGVTSLFVCPKCERRVCFWCRKRNFLIIATDICGDCANKEASPPDSADSHPK
jgi:hypothetical protein